MSATNRGSQRHPDDFYETPDWVTDLILPHLRLDGEAVQDLGCGTGNIGRRVLDRCDIEVVGVELDPHRASVAEKRGLPVINQDVLSFEFAFDSATVIMNPPFKLALEFVKKGLELDGPKGEVAALLRLNWLASKSRRSFHHAFPSDIYVLPKRPSFTGDGKSDATEYAWFVWGPGRGNRWFVL